MVEQGDIVRVEGIVDPVLILSKNFYNQTGAAVVCPVVKRKSSEVTQYPVNTRAVSGHAMCDNLRQIYYERRGYSVLDRITVGDQIEIFDIIYSVLEVI